jgi:hypothetical protein
MATADTLPPKAKRLPDRGPAVAAVRAIDPKKLYPAREFRRLAIFGDFSWRKLKRQGMRVLRWDKKEFVLGQDFLDFLINQTNGKDATDDRNI